MDKFSRFSYNWLARFSFVGNSKLFCGHVLELAVSYFNYQQNMFKTTAATAVALGFLSTFPLCRATSQISATFLAGKSVATNHIALRLYSEIQCAAKCFEESRYNRCRVAGYNKETHTCYRSHPKDLVLVYASWHFLVGLLCRLQINMDLRPSHGETRINVFD